MPFLKYWLRFKISLFLMARSEQNIPPVDAYFSAVIESRRARGFRPALGEPVSQASLWRRKQRAGWGRQEARRPPASSSDEDRVPEHTLCFQLGFCDPPAKQGFTKQKPPEHSHTFWLILLVFVLTGISCLPSHLYSMLPGRI